MTNGAAWLALVLPMLANVAIDRVVPVGQGSGIALARHAAVNRG